MKIELWERTAFRIIIFLLCAAFVAGSFCLILLGDARMSVLSRQGLSYQLADIFPAKRFFESETLHVHMLDNVYNLAFLYNHYAGENGPQIDSGPAYEKAVESMFRDLYEQIRNDIRNKQEYYGGVSYWEVYWNWGYHGRAFNFDETKMLEDPVLSQGRTIKPFSEPGVREAFEALFPEQIAEMREMIAEDRRTQYRQSMEALEGTLFFVSDGEKMLSSVELDSAGYPLDPDALRFQNAWIMIENRTMFSSHQGINDSNPGSEFGKATLQMAWPDTVLAKYENLYKSARQIILLHFLTAIVLLALALVFLILLIVFTGRKRPAYEDTRKLWALDKIFVEFQVALFIIVFALGAMYASMLAQNFYNGIGPVNEGYLVIGGILGFIICVAALWFLLSLIRIGKAGLFAERSLIGMFLNGPCKELADVVKSGYDGRNPLAKTIILIVLFWVLTAFFAGLCGIGLVYDPGWAAFFAILLLLTLAGALWFTRRWVERYGRLRKGVEEISSGNLGYKIDIRGGGKNEFERLSALVNELGAAQNTAILNELKNQRLKTDLISNVSHDLKTPLTSILTYTDLLKTEGTKSKNAEEYLRIIDEKGKRLQKLTDDLFEAAKASSGAISVRKEKVDILALINQEIAEMNGSFADAGLELVIKADSENYYVEADSQLLWRVVDNLLGNARKYSQAGTRVYIELKEHRTAVRNGAAGHEGVAGTAGAAGEKRSAGQAGRIFIGASLMTTLEIKNTSATKLNIPPEELMERFKRGDEARATEGSGLGLAIAKDLVRLQGGWFEIFIDGDLFKAVVMLPPYPEQP